MFGDRYEGAGRTASRSEHGGLRHRQRHVAAAVAVKADSCGGCATQANVLRYRSTGECHRYGTFMIGSRRQSCACGIRHRCFMPALRLSRSAAPMRALHRHSVPVLFDRPRSREATKLAQVISALAKRPASKPRKRSIVELRSNHRFRPSVFARSSNGVELALRFFSDVPHLEPSSFLPQSQRAVECLVEHEHVFVSARSGGNAVTVQRSERRHVRTRRSASWRKSALSAPLLIR